MSLKFVLAISLFCCVYLAPIYCQSQEFYDYQFTEAKERDKNKIPVPLPTSKPQVQQPNGQNLQQNRYLVRANLGTPKPHIQQQYYLQNQNNRPQSPPSNPLFYYPRFERQEFKQHSNCMQSQQLAFCQENFSYQINSLPGNIPDNRKPSHS